MSLRIAFDLDGVLADMDREITRQAEILFSQDTPPGTSEDEGGSVDDQDGPAPARLSLTVRQHHHLWRRVRSIENFWETLEEIEEGAIKRVAELARSRRWEVIFLTSRPKTAGDTTQTQTQRWLQAKGFRIPSVYVVKGSRGLIAAALDLYVVVDDRMENCMDVLSDSKAKAILLWRDESQQLPTAARRLGIGVAASVSECLATLTQLESGMADPPNRLDRVKRLLGLKEPALD